MLSTGQLLKKEVIMNVEQISDMFLYFAIALSKKQRGKGLNYCQYELADINYNIYIVIFLQIYVHL